MLGTFLSDDVIDEEKLDCYEYGGKGSAAI